MPSRRSPCEEWFSRNSTEQIQYPGLVHMRHLSVPEPPKYLPIPSQVPLAMARLPLQSLQGHRYLMATRRRQPNVKDYRSMHLLL